MLRAALTIAAAGALAGVFAGCKPSAPDSAAPPAASRLPAAPEPTTIEETIERIHALRSARLYSELERLVVPERRSDVTDLLLAVDQLLSANRRIQDIANRKLGRGMAVIWDLATIRNNLGILSDSIRLIGCEQNGPQLVATIQELDHVPLVRETFERRDGRWLYVPQGTDPEFTRQLMALGRVVQQIGDQLDAGRLSVRDMDEAYRCRVVPLIRELDQNQRRLRTIAAR
ncbi:MAG: hypothetical protein L6Q92_10330 [Phycisphaerae bacterium]|nr:hypothetical protein [Phycisphaerae bacterium]